jgi:hypothetical protein
MNKVEALYDREFDLLIAKQAGEGLDLNDLRRLDIITRSWRAYSSNQIKKDENEDLSLYTDDVLKKILQGTNNVTNDKSESESSRQPADDRSGKVDTL